MFSDEKIIRCDWVGNNDLYVKYHDDEWGVPVYDSKKLFENLCLEGQQSGLSWITVLKKRTEYRKVFFNFDPEKIQYMTAEDVEKLLQNNKLIRHRKKLESVIKNARAFMKMKENGEDFSKFIWSFVSNKPLINSVKSKEDLIIKSDISKNMSKELKKRGFSFVGEITCYSFMQSSGIVNDHFNNCYFKKK